MLIWPDFTLFMQRWLRSADVRILRQLVAVHEGIEAMRWLMEERDTLVSRCSSLTGSLSSLATVEEHGPSMSPCRYSVEFGSCAVSNDLLYLHLIMKNCSKQSDKKTKISPLI